MIEKRCVCPNCDTLIPEDEVICPKCAYDLIAQKGED